MKEKINTYVRPWLIYWGFIADPQNLALWLCCCNLSTNKFYLHNCWILYTWKCTVNNTKKFLLQTVAIINFSDKQIAKLSLNNYLLVFWLIEGGNTVLALHDLSQIFDIQILTAILSKWQPNTSHPTALEFL